MYHIQLQLRNYLIALCSILVLIVLATGLIAVSRPVSSRAASPSTSLSLTFTCAQAVDNVSGRVCVHTSASAALTIKVKYCSGYYATSASLKGTKHANTAGNYTWTWKPQTTCRGPATAYVTASLSGQNVLKSDAFTVQ
jgi:hypothetical protein